MKAFIYTIIFLVAVLLPVLIITTNAIKKESSGKDYAVTYSSGNCAIQYNVQHHDSALRKWHQKKGAWIPLREGMKTGTGDRIKTEKDSLRFIELEEGDYQDPWKNDYYYEKIGPIRAILISAGPDKNLHTRDDIIIPITL